MKIHAEMCLDELVTLMGDRHGADRPIGTDFATGAEARALRCLLVRDFDGLDTDGISLEVWNTYCCAVDPYHR